MLSSLRGRYAGEISRIQGCRDTGMDDVVHYQRLSPGGSSMMVAMLLEISIVSRQEDRRSPALKIAGKCGHAA